MTDYADTQAIKDMLGGAWGASGATGSGSTRDAILAILATRHSRLFDMEVGVPANHFAAGTNITRRYAGSGGTVLEVDDFDSLSAVTVWNDQAGSSTQAYSLSNPVAAYYAQKLPLEGPPYRALFTLGGWPADAFGIGNVLVTGTVSVPAEVTHAVAVWAAYAWRTREAGWSDTSERADGVGQSYRHAIPPEAWRVIEAYRRRLGAIVRAGELPAARGGIGEIVLRPAWAGSGP